MPQSDFIDDAPCGHLSVAMDGHIISVNKTLLEWTGKSREQLLAGLKLEDLLTKDCRIFYETYLEPLFRVKGSVSEVALELIREDQEPLPVFVNMAKRERGAKEIIRVVVFSASKRRRFERDLQAARREAERIGVELSLVLESTSDCVIAISPDWKISYANARASALFSHIGTLIGHQFHHILPYGGDEFFQKCDMSMRYAQPQVFDTFVSYLDRWLTVNVCTSGGGLALFFRDITESRRLEEDRTLALQRLSFLAHHDPITGLPNRLSLQSELERICNSKVPFAIFYLDLDHFKYINDTLGHSAGDELLSVIAERLRGCCQETDVIARLGGDEFALIATNVAGLDGPARTACKILDAVAAPCTLHAGTVGITCSIGVTLSQESNNNPDTVLREADIALYRAKASGRRCCQFFEPSMDLHFRDFQALKPELDRALRLHEFELHYQPIVSLRTGRATCMEALIRWRHPVRGLLSPAEFVPVAEETGLIVPIGNWVIEQACKDALDWPDEVRVAVNVSAMQFQTGRLVEDVRASLVKAGLPPRRLELEMTESFLLQDKAGTLSVLRQLRSAGVRIALDDFGTGYSSLSYLGSFPFDKVKIDQSFVAGLFAKQESLAIIRAIVSIGASLGVVITAEGVETIRQLQAVRAEGCDEAQGYYFSRPVNAFKAAALLTELNPLEARFGPCMEEATRLLETA